MKGSSIATNTSIIDEEMQRMVKEQYERTKQILTERRDLLELIAQTLLVEETLDAEQIEHLEKYGKLPERSYSSTHTVNSEGASAKEETSEAVSEGEVVTEDKVSLTKRQDPTTSDLPQENVTGKNNDGIQEERD